jgi:predicted PurR-regulated permease PerM
MKQGKSFLQNIGLRKIITVVLVAITFLVVPVFGYGPLSQAQAETLIAEGSSYTVDSATVKRIQQKAEDLGDGAERPIGDTGLKNIKKLGENIPETLKLNARQKLGTDNPEDLVNNAQDRVEGAAKATKRAVKDAAS